MKNFLILLLFLLLFSCTDNSQPIVIGQVSYASTPEVVTKPFSNPVLIYGSSFGNYFQSLYRIGDFESMLKFTSSSSIKKYGKKAILERYEKMKFNYRLALTSTKKEGDITVLNYSSNIIATRTMIRLRVAVENDTCKVILPDNLDEFPE